MIRKLSLLLLSVVTLCFLVACGAETPVGEQPVAEEGYIYAKDVFGDQVKVKKSPQHVATVFASTTHMLALLGDADKVVCISEGNTRDYLFCEMFPQVLEARIVKSNNNAISVEETMKEPAPDLMLVNLEATLEEKAKGFFNKSGMDVFCIGFSSLEDLKANFTLLGEIMGREAKAVEYNTYCDYVIDLITSRTADIPLKEQARVYHAVNELLRTDNADSLSGDWMGKMGIVNVGTEINSDVSFLASKNIISLEELLQADPDYIIINGADVYDYIQSNEQLHVLKAYRNDNIHIMPLGVTRWGHPNSIETPLAMLWTAKTIYPEKFKDVDIRQETKNFYHNMFDYDLSEEQVDNILGGRLYKNIKGTGGSGL